MVNSRHLLLLLGFAVSQSSNHYVIYFRKRSPTASIRSIKMFVPVVKHLHRPLEGQDSQLGLSWCLAPERLISMFI